MDALIMKGWHESDWSSLGRNLDRIERYNGLGYRSRGIYSPYLWACTSAYSVGAFVAYGVFDRNAVVNFCGAVPILLELQARGHLITDAAD